MENTFYDFKVPDGAPSEPRPRAKRIAELNQSLIFSTQKKNYCDPSQPRPKAKRMAELLQSRTFSTQEKNYNYRNSMSVNKFSNKKPTGLSQNMSTSKKLAIDKKRMSHCAIKRAIDFSSAMQKNVDIVNAENCIIKNEVSKTRGTMATINENSSSRCLYYPKLGQPRTIQRNVQTFSQLSLRTTPKSAQRKTTPIKSASKKTTPSNDQRIKDPKYANSIQSPTRPPCTKKRSPLKSIDIESNMNVSSCSSSSDKENSDEASDMKNFISKKSLRLIASHQRMLENYKSSELPHCRTDQSKIRDLTQNNFKIISQIMKLSLELIENNKELLNVAFESNGMSSKDRVVLGEKQLDDVTVSDQQTEDTSDENTRDLRRIAFANLGKCKDETTLQKNSPESKLKKSRVMYESMKSNMKILKTPRGQGYDDRFETPNARCRSVTSKNVQKQLERLYDS